MQAVQRSRTEQQIPEVLRAMLFPAVRLMSWTDTPYYMTPHDIRQLPREAFAKLYTVRAASDAHVMSALCLHHCRYLFAVDPLGIGRQL